MTAQWSVRKRDGVWHAFDYDGDSRYASADWWQAVTFACLSADETPATDNQATIEAQWQAAIRHTWLRHLWMLRKRRLDDDSDTP